MSETAAKTAKKVNTKEQIKRGFGENVSEICS